MKKIILAAFLLIMTPLYAVSATQSDADLLKEKLAQFKQINAQFSQVVTNAEGKVLNKSEGTLSISRPGKFRWEVLTPEQDLIISDGVTMWMYSPFIEQVTLVNLSDAIAGTPFVLLSGATQAQWDKYTVKKQNEQFMIKTKDLSAPQNSFIFEFDKTGNISRFEVIEAQGQRSDFALTYSQKSKNIPADYFTFSIPEGVEVDDQR